MNVGWRSCENEEQSVESQQGERDYLSGISMGMASRTNARIEPGFHARPVRFADPSANDTSTRSDRDDKSGTDNSSAGSDALHGPLWKRFLEAYKQELAGEGNGPAPARRIPAAPLDSPPYPNADWNYGGSSVIGADTTTNYPLTRALYSGPDGEAWKASRVQVYGWINPGLNFNTSNKSNLPLGYNFYPNRVELDQFVTYIERDSNRGFRLQVRARKMARGRGNPVPGRVPVNTRSVC